MINFEKAQHTSNFLRETGERFFQQQLARRDKDGYIYHLALINCNNLNTEQKISMMTLYRQAVSDVLTTTFQVSGHYADIQLDMGAIDVAQGKNFMPHYTAQKNSYSDGCGVIVSLLNLPEGLLKIEDTEKQINALKFLLSKSVFSCGLSFSTTYLFQASKKVKELLALTYAFAAKVCGKEKSLAALQILYDNYPDEYEVTHAFGNINLTFEEQIEVLSEHNIYKQIIDDLCESLKLKRTNYKGWFGCIEIEDINFKPLSQD